MELGNNEQDRQHGMLRGTVARWQRESMAERQDGNLATARHPSPQVERLGSRGGGRGCRLKRGEAEVRGAARSPLHAQPASEKKASGTMQVERRRVTASRRLGEYGLGRPSSAGGGRRQRVVGVGEQRRRRARQARRS